MRAYNSPFGWPYFGWLDEQLLLVLAGWKWLETAGSAGFWRQSPLHIQIQIFVPMQHIT